MLVEGWNEIHIIGQPGMELGIVRQEGNKIIIAVRGATDGWRRDEIPETDTKHFLFEDSDTYLVRKEVKE